ncbi:acyl-CoA thioesterase [Oceanomicrobium pacificus]|uniref:Thioeseterase n=1 Tax=Oceanomicrobium pacificus TaxID=2692916 RepID=A0A6B0TI23_9RHOB|nr:acyl-CoA thioesterase [Oceanomicrobium pacificus]MXU64060.1 thioeseterase [Oceanomicrobium pacificus]
MYPLIRFATELWLARKEEPLPLDGTHVSTHRCMPWDIDIWGELNNGRTLTLFDLGRIPLAGRVGLIKVLRENRWGLTMAGASVRYRRRVRAFDKVEMHSRCIGRDEKFLYLQQSMWRGDEAANSILYRSAVTDRNGIVPTQIVAEALGQPDWNPPLPAWVQAWIDAEAERVWPPERDGGAPDAGVADVKLDHRAA